MRRVREMLPGAMQNPEILRAARAARVLREWPRVVGDGLSARSWPDRYDRGTVWVAVQGSAWAQELRLMKPMILSRLHELAGESGLFTDVRFGVRKLPERVFQPEKPEPTPPAPPDLAEMTIAERAAWRLAHWPSSNPGPETDADVP